MVQAPRVNESDSLEKRLQSLRILLAEDNCVHFDGPHNDKFLILSPISLVGCSWRSGRRGGSSARPVILSLRRWAVC